jgi:hypothetical protein
MREWPPLATNSSDTYAYDWRRLLDTGVTVLSVSYEADPNSGLTFSNNSITSNVASIKITATNNVGKYWIKMTPTLSSGSISAMSIPIEVKKHVRG